MRPRALAHQVGRRRPPRRRPARRASARARPRRARARRSAPWRGRGPRRRPGATASSARPVPREPAPPARRASPGAPGRARRRRRRAARRAAAAASAGARRRARSMAVASLTPAVGAVVSPLGLPARLPPALAPLVAAAAEPGSARGSARSPRPCPRRAIASAMSARAGDHRLHLLARLGEARQHPVGAVAAELGGRLARPRAAAAAKLAVAEPPRHRSQRRCAPRARRRPCRGRSRTGRSISSWTTSTCSGRRVQRARGRADRVPRVVHVGQRHEQRHRPGGPAGLGAAAAVARWRTGARRAASPAASTTICPALWRVPA